MHTANGLIDACAHSRLDQHAAEWQLIRFMQDQFACGSPMGGATINFDRGFINKYMPTLGAQFHYRNIDTSTVKALAKLWCPEIPDTPAMEGTAHRALDDVRESIAQLRHYKEWIFDSATANRGFMALMAGA
jgi:oligoribonuclease